VLGISSGRGCLCSNPFNVGTIIYYYYYCLCLGCQLVCSFIEFRGYWRGWGVNNTIHPCNDMMKHGWVNVKRTGRKLSPKSCRKCGIAPELAAVDLSLLFIFELGGKGTGYEGLTVHDEFKRRSQHSGSLIENFPVGRTRFIDHFILSRFMTSVAAFIYSRRP